MPQLKLKPYGIPSKLNGRKAKQHTVKRRHSGRLSINESDYFYSQDVGGWVLKTNAQ
jgi:hypothetical protein